MKKLKRVFKVSINLLLKFSNKVKKSLGFILKKSHSVKGYAVMTILQALFLLLVSLNTNYIFLLPTSLSIILFQLVLIILDK